MSNRLNQLMQQKHEELLKEWFEQAIAAYPAEAHKYFVRVHISYASNVHYNTKIISCKAFSNKKKLPCEKGAFQACILL